MKKLDLILKAKWYDMIESGAKTEEYREITPYWVNRLCKVEDDTDKFIKDHINKGSVGYIMTEERMKLLKDHLDNNTHKDPIPISGKALLRGFDPKGKEFIAKAKNCALRFEQPSEEQQELIEKSKKKMDKIMDENMIHVNAALTEYVHQFKMYPNNIEIKLILDNEVVDKTTTHFNFSVQPILIPE